MSLQIFFVLGELSQATAKDSEPVVRSSAILLPTDGDLYAKEVARAEAGDETIDFRALRFAYLESAAYRRARSDNTLRELKKKILTAAKAGAHEQVRSTALQILSIEYINLYGHKFLRQSCSKLNDDACERHHHYIEFGLLRSITSSGNGKSCDTAWEVVNLEEEYFILFALGVKLDQQSLINSVKHHCDEMHVTDKTGSTKTYYFNVDAVLAHAALRSEQ